MQGFPPTWRSLSSSPSYYLRLAMPEFSSLLRPSLTGPLLMVAATLLFAVLNVCIKLLGPEYSSWDIVFYRSFGGLLLLLLLGGGWRAFVGRNYSLLLLRGCLGAGAFVCMVLAIRLLPVSTAMVIFFTYPAFAALLSMLLLKEAISGKEILCLLIALCGPVVLFDFELNGNLLGQIIALLGGLSAGAAIITVQRLRRQHGPIVIYLYFCAVCALVATPGFIADPTFPDTALELLLVGGLIFSSLTAQLLMNQGFLYCKGWEGGVFMMSEVIFTAAIGIGFLGDPAGLRFWLGSALIIGGALGLNLLRATRHTP